MYIIQSTDMRYEPEHKIQTRDRIVRKTASKLRAEGLNGPGVASVMKASGLTVGGFYKHFLSKDELFAEAIAQAFSDSEKVYSSLQNVPREDRWKEVVRGTSHPSTAIIPRLVARLRRSRLKLLAPSSASENEFPG